MDSNNNKLNYFNIDSMVKFMDDFTAVDSEKSKVNDG